jgi:hypothetical protein
MEIRKFKIIDYRPFSRFRHTGYLHTVETLCYLGGLKLVSVSFVRRGLLKMESVFAVAAPSEDAWERFSDAAFHQWYGYERIPDEGKALPMIPMQPLKSGANECMGRRFVDAVYMTNYVPV